MNVEVERDVNSKVFDSLCGFEPNKGNRIPLNVLFAQIRGIHTCSSPTGIPVPILVLSFDHKCRG